MDRIVRLLEPIRIGTLQLRNRMAMPPMTMGYAAETGGVSQQQIDYFVARARGGVGLIIVGGVCVESKLGKLFAPAPLLCIDHDDFVAGYSRLVEAVHDHGVKIAIQLYHAGRQTTLEKTGGRQPVSSSDVKTRLMGLVKMPDARAVSLDEINQLENAYASAARRAATAGFDAVLLDGGAGYGIAQFMSPFVNKRADAYGGDLTGRMRFPLQIIEKIRRRLGPDYPLLFDLPVDELVEGGIRPEESKAMASLLERAGISAFRVHVGLYETYQYIVPPAGLPRAVHGHLGKEIKGAVHHAKVMLGHRINDPTVAEDVLTKGMADIILLGRALIADPDFPKKVTEGRLEEIRKCIACNRGCAGRIVEGLPATCTVNPMVGREKTSGIIPAQSPKRVFVIGGGPGGMEAARVASLRGHNVFLFEKTANLGGKAIVAAIPPHKYELRELTRYFIHQIKKLKIEVHLQKEMDCTEILLGKPDAVIVATGAIPRVPDIPGTHHPHVIRACDVLTEGRMTGHRTVVVGGGQLGLETAEFLAWKGRTVLVLEALPEVGRDMELLTKVFMLSRITNAGVIIRTNTKVDEVNQRGVKSGDEWIEADSVVLSIGHESDNRLYDSLKGRVSQLFAIGDCVKPRKILHAIQEGARAARQI